MTERNVNGRKSLNHSDNWRNQLHSKPRSVSVIEMFRQLEALVTLIFGAPKLFVSQSLNGVQTRGTDGGHHTADQPYGSED